MTLDGWSLDKKIKVLREDVEKQMADLKMNFAILYDYMKKMEKQRSEPKTNKKKVKN